MASQIGIIEIGDEAHEVVLLVVLDSQNGINAIHRVFQGRLNSNIAHPSGNLEPSQADLYFTERVVEAGSILGIEVLDIS